MNPDPSTFLPSVRDTRFLVAFDDVVGADRLCVELRAAGATAQMVDPLGLELVRLHDYDAQILVARPGQDLRFLRDRMLRHPGLRFTSLLTYAATHSKSEGDRKLELMRLSREVHALLSADRELEANARRAQRSFEAPVGDMGLSRVLRVLARCEDVFRLTLNVSNKTALIELAANLVLNVVVEARGEPKMLGAEALAAAFEFEAPKATVEKRPQLLAPCFCEPIDRALVSAFLESRERRMTSDAESPTLRMRSPFKQVGDDETPNESASTAPSRISDLPLADLIGPLPAPPRVPSVSGFAPKGRETPLTQRSIGSRFRPRNARVFLGILLLCAGITGVWMAQRTRTASQHAAIARAQDVALGSHVEKPLDDSARLKPQAARAPTVTAVASETANAADLAAASEPTSSDTASDDARTLARRAQKALQKGDIAEALSLAERALALRPNRLPLIVLYADALKAAGRREEALAAYQRALEKKPSDPEIETRFQELSHK